VRACSRQKQSINSILQIWFWIKAAPHRIWWKERKGGLGVGKICLCVVDRVGKLPFLGSVYILVGTSELWHLPPFCAPLCLIISVFLLYKLPPNFKRFFSAICDNLSSPLLQSLASFVCCYTLLNCFRVLRRSYIAIHNAENVPSISSRGNSNSFLI